MRRSVIIIGTLLVLAGCGSKSGITGPVKVTGGEVSGIRGKDPSVMAFRGIPFAAPPVGDLRWAEPKPVVPWQGVRQVVEFGNSCIQLIVKERKPHTYEFMAHNAISEDCLYLNVWTAAKSPSERRPVYMFIHGGGNREGSGAVPVYDGEGLAKKGVVLVTVNYRLGVFGYFTYPELTKEAPYHSSGNYGILDLIAALEWVRDNIAAFGGDPQKVTIGGQSAGSRNTHVLTASPLARGLFRGAIAESGSGVTSPMSARTLAEMEQLGIKFANAKGAASLADLRRMTWEKLAEPVKGDAADPYRSAFGFQPVVDGYVLPAADAEIFAQAKQNDVATITGCNKDESGASGQPEVTLAQYRKQTVERFQELAQEFLRLYPAKTDEEARAAQNERARDQARVSMYLWAVNRGKTAKTKAYTYFWDHALPGPDAGTYGAFHTSEVPYVLNSLAMADRPFTEADHRIADMMSSYWANFIATGNPNGTGLAAWPAVEEKPGFTMELGDLNQPIPVAGSKEKLELYKKYFSKPRPPQPRP